MGQVVIVKVKREIISKTSSGVSSSETFRFPLDSKEHHIRMMELDAEFKVISYSEDLSNAVIETNYGKIKYQKGGFINHFSVKKEPRFLFFVSFELAFEEYSSSKLEGYELIIKESVFISDIYFSKEKNKKYSLPVILDKTLFLELLQTELVIVGVDSINKKVLVDINDEEIEVSKEKPGEYENSGQSGYNDSFEVWNKKVKVSLEKK